MAKLSQEHIKTAELLKKIRSHQVQESVVVTANRLSPTRTIMAHSQEINSALPLTAVPNDPAADEASRNNNSTEQSSNSIEDTAPLSSQCTVAAKRAVQKYDPPFNGSEMAKFGLSTLLQAWNKCGLIRFKDRFTSTTSSTNKTKLRQVVEYAYAAADEKTLADLKRPSPDPLQESDAYRQWASALEIAASTTEKGVMIKLLEQEKQTASVLPPAKKKRKLPDKTNYVFALHSRIQDLK